MNLQVYNYSESDDDYLEYCKIEGSADSERDNYTIMEIKTPKQNKTNKTNLLLMKKLPKAEIFLQNFTDETWPDNKGVSMFTSVYNNNLIATANLAWYPDKAHSKVYLIRVSGKWHNSKDGVEKFNFLINLNRPQVNQMIQSDDQKENTDAKVINPVEVYGESDAVVVKGAESGATIKICNESGVEIKTVVANNNIERINLPAKQLYFIHIGNSQYKVALSVP